MGKSVPQGSILSPPFIRLYTNNLASTIKLLFVIQITSEIKIKIDTNRISY